MGRCADAHRPLCQTLDFIRGLMHYKSVIALLSSLFLFGCAGTYNYIPSEGAETAKLKLLNIETPIALISENLECPKRKLDKTKSEVVIPAGKRILVEVGHSSLGHTYGRECIISLSFIPQNRKEYSISYNQYVMSCSAHILTNDELGNSIQDPSVKQEPFNRCLY